MSDQPAPFPEGALDRQRWGSLVEGVLDRVTTAIARERFPHAVLFSGPEGMGRELVAIETAAMLVGAGCDVPYSDSRDARRVRSGIHPDVVVLRGEGRKQIVKIDTIRRIVKDAPGRPFEGRCRVWVVDSVDARRLPPESANAFLKVLEEPPSHVRFLLLGDATKLVLAALILPGLWTLLGRKKN